MDTRRLLSELKIRASDTRRGFILSSCTASVPAFCSNCHIEFTLSIAEFLAFPCFRRTWVRQEIFASRAATTLCGPLVLPWRTFVEHIKVRGEILPRNPSSMDIRPSTEQLTLLDRGGGKFRLHERVQYVGYPSLVYETSDRGSGGEKVDEVDLFSVLANSKKFGANFPRDIVYGVLAMTSARSSDREPKYPVLNINYDWNGPKVFRKATEYFIRRSACLSTMFLAQLNRHPSGQLACLRLWWCISSLPR